MMTITIICLFLVVCLFAVWIGRLGRKYADTQYELQRARERCANLENQNNFYRKENHELTEKNTHLTEDNDHLRDSNFQLSGMIQHICNRESKQINTQKKKH